MQISRGKRDEAREMGGGGGEEKSRKWETNNRNEEKGYKQENCIVFA